MNAKVLPKQDTKLVLLEAGMQAMLERGYTNTGIQEVLTSVGVPKGSFYHYFESKEDFALSIIQHFDQKHSANLARLLSDVTVSPLQRLHNYCEEKKQMIAAWKCCKGCLIGNLSQEMSDQSEILRMELAKVMAKWRESFAKCIAEGQQLGEIKPVPDANKLAALFLDAWEGAVMRAKMTKSVDPLDGFINLMFDHVLKT
jgi:TetR/AcrR family transcriptional repressor of nem operon